MIRGGQFGYRTVEVKMLFWLSMSAVFAQEFGDAFEDEGNSGEFNNAEQAEMELILKLEACKETPETKDCQEFFLQHGDELGVDLEKYVLPEKVEVDQPIDEDNFEFPEEPILESAMDDSTTLDSEPTEFNKSIGLVSGVGSFQALNFIQGGPSVTIASDKMVFRTTVSMLAIQQIVPILDEDGQPTDIITQSWRLLASLEQAVLLPLDFGSSFTPYVGGTLVLWPSYVGQGSGNAVGLTANAGVNRVVIRKPQWALTLNADVNVGSVTGQYFQQVPSPAGGTLNSSGVKMGIGVYPSIAF